MKDFNTTPLHIGLMVKEVGEACATLAGALAASMKAGTPLFPAGEIHPHRAELLARFNVVSGRVKGNRNGETPMQCVDAARILAGVLRATADYLEEIESENHRV